MIVTMKKTTERVRQFLMELFTGVDLDPATPRVAKKLRIVIVMISLIVAFDAIMLFYIFVGHERGWPRAEKWYNTVTQSAE